MDVAEGEAAGARVSRWGWRSFLMSCGTLCFKELYLNQNKVACFSIMSLKKAIKKQKMRTEDVPCRKTDESHEHEIVAKGLFIPHLF